MLKMCIMLAFLTKTDGIQQQKIMTWNDVTGNGNGNHFISTKQEWCEKHKLNVEKKVRLILASGLQPQAKTVQIECLCE